MAEKLPDPFQQDAAAMYGDPGDPQAAQMPAIQPPAISQGGLAVQVHGGIITAQKVANPRNLKKVMGDLSVLAKAAGSKYVYSWEVKNKDNTKSRIEGATIVLAQDLARTWGNCQVDCTVRDDGAYWTFHARFVDLETGYSITRPFQQRKGQDTGMRDQGRALDIVFQIGASKAIRNVICNALPTMADRCVEWAKSGLLERITGNRKGAEEYLLNQLGQFGIALELVEGKFARKWKDFRVEDLASLYGEIESIRDGFLSVDDAYPADAVSLPEKEAEKEKEKAKGGKKAAADKSDGQSPDKSEEASEPEPSKEEAKQEPAAETAEEAQEAAEAEQAQETEEPKKAAEASQKVSDDDLEFG